MPTPDARALGLLQAVLTPEQWAVFMAQEMIPVVGSAGGVYQIRRGRSGNVSRLEDGKEVERFCIHQKEKLPIADTMLAQVLLLQCDEGTFKELANRWAAGGLFADRPYVPPGLPMDGSRILPEVPDASGMAQLRLIRQCVTNPGGREALAAAILARIQRAATEDVMDEVTQLANLLMNFAELDLDGPSVRGVAEWLGHPHLDVETRVRGSRAQGD